MKPALQSRQSYLPDMKRMVELCRRVPGAYIPPSWAREEQAREIAEQIGAPVEGDQR